MSARTNLADEAGRLQRARWAAHLAGLALCAIYVAASSELSPGLLALEVALLGTASVVAQLFFHRRLSRTMRAVRSLAQRGHAPAEELRTLVVELFRTPDRVFRGNFQQWLVSVLVTAAVLWVSGLSGGRVALGVAGAGLLCIPLTAMLGYLITTLAARRVLRVVGRMGLSPEEVVAAAPRSKRQLSRRLVLFIAITVVTPAVMMADLSGSLTGAGVEQVLEAPTPQAKAELAARLDRQEIVGTVGFGVLMFLVALGMSALAASALSEPLQEIGREVEALAQGKVARPVMVPAEDEVWSVAAAFTTMQAHLAKVLSQLQTAGAQIGSSSEQLLVASNRYRERANDQAAALGETSATTEELAQSARQISERAAAVANLSNDTFEAAQAGLSGGQSFAQAMEKMRKSNAAISRALNTLSVRVRQIGRSVEFIKQVADKSDLLALSAELEATKAGDLGQGFSLVAGEVRRLADNVIRSTDEIERLIEEIGGATQAAVRVTEAGLETTEKGAGLAKLVADRMSVITDVAGRTAEAVKSISAATHEQETATGQLAEAMTEILRANERSTGAAEQVTAANVGLNRITERLKAAVGRFEIGGQRTDDGRPGPRAAS